MLRLIPPPIFLAGPALNTCLRRKSPGAAVAPGPARGAHRYRHRRLGGLGRPDGAGPRWARPPVPGADGHSVSATPKTGNRCTPRSDSVRRLSAKEIIKGGS